MSTHFLKVIAICHFFNISQQYYIIIEKHISLFLLSSSGLEFDLELMFLFFLKVQAATSMKQWLSNDGTPMSKCSTPLYVEQKPGCQMTALILFLPCHRLLALFLEFKAKQKHKEV